MRNHNNKPVFGYIFKQIHYLHAVFAVKRARRLVGKNNVGIVDNSTGNRNALHFAARKFARLFAHGFTLARKTVYAR